MHDLAIFLVGFVVALALCEMRTAWKATAKG
ncbi:uncharacterized protein CMC5_074810 [Chondromyces crocatus]|uniref:Uncharacterized protein n=1 Tax=Chondromyces crocatus TaxID=52 RepID=A0A0K1EQP7_CHOCO|nr:uncharacterized protein CMC5_074810 [Chondromyces crocatus]